MFATIGFRTGPGRADWSICCADEDWAQPYLVDTVWLDRQAQAGWADMWRYAAEHFRDQHIVVGYKLMVEPNAAAFHLGIYDPAVFYRDYAGSTYDWNSFFPAIIAAIREVDSQTPILVSADDFSSIEWLPYVNLVTDERTLYYVDQYAPHAYTHQDASAIFSYPGTFDTDFDGDSEVFDLAWLEDHLNGIDAFMAQTGEHVAVEEFGVHRWSPGAVNYLSDEMALFEARNLNYAIWEWTSSWKEYSVEVNDFNVKFGTDSENVNEMDNELLAVLISYWARNTLRPSMVSWEKE